MNLVQTATELARRDQSRNKLPTGGPALLHVQIANSNSFEVRPNQLSSLVKSGGEEVDSSGDPKGCLEHSAQDSSERAGMLKPAKTLASSSQNVDSSSTSLRQLRLNSKPMPTNGSIR